MKKILVSLMVIACVAGLGYADTKFDSDVTVDGAAVTFKAQTRGVSVKAISASCGADSKSVDMYVKDDSNALNPYTVSAVSVATCTVVNTGITVTNSDRVVYQHVNGKVDYRTVSSATATTIVLSSAPSVAYAAGDKIYELAQQGEFQLGVTNTAGMASVIESGDPLVKTPADSPLYVEILGATNNIITVTVE